MSGNGSRPATVTVTINGRSVEVEEGRLLIDVAEEMGVFVPRFCYHPGMKSVAVCRMCLVAIEGQRKLMPACATPVADGMVVNTSDEQAVDAQRGMLEFLLINHPLDCPICDRAGECPLQDQTYRHGPGTTRYVDPKRTFEKPIEISNLVVLDRERCVLCWRCVRFADEVAGDQFIQLVDRGPGTQILTFKDDPFDSYFSGNTIQICPVGALTSKPYRFVSRPWNLKSAPTICAYCSVGCPMSNETRAGKLVRCQALPNENVNDFWTCDKGRFAYHYVDSEERLTSPLLRNAADEFDVVTWEQALEEVARKAGSAERVGVVAGGHLTTEDAFAIARLARKTIGTPHVDSRLHDATAPYELLLDHLGVAGSTATLNDVENAERIMWIGPDPKETLPVLYLRLRKAVVDNDAELVVVSPRRISLDYIAARIVRSRPGSEAQDLRALEHDDKRRTVVCWGPAHAGRDDSSAVSAALELARRIDARFLACPPHAGSQGLIDMGVLPGLVAGHRRAPTTGKDTRAILEAAAAGDLDTLFIFGADVVTDFPDADLAERALASDVFTVVVELLPSDTVAYADAVLPASAFAEREGTFTNLERRLQKLEPALTPPGSAADPWRICARIAAALGDDWRWDEFGDVWTTITAEVPSHSTVDIDALAQRSPTPHAALGGGWQGDPSLTHVTVAGPAGQYPKGFRSGAPFHTGQNWPLSWELRAFEARQRPGLIPEVSTNGAAESTGGDDDGSPEPESKTVSSGEDDGFPEPESKTVSSGEGVPSPAAATADESRAEERSGSEGESKTVSRPEGAGRDAGPDEFDLLTGRLLYDEGGMVARTAALRALARRPFIEMNERDAARLGLRDGDEAVVTAGDFEVRLTVVIADIVEGAVFVPWDQPGLRANRLIRGIDPTVKVQKR